MGDFGAPLLSEPKGLREDLSVSSPDECVNILVTGFGPFKTNPLNPSFLIASALPKTLYCPASASGVLPREVRIHVHPSPIRVSYSAVRTAMPEVLDNFRKANNGRSPDIVLHIGMASTRHYYSVESLAHRDGYKITDVDGQVGLEDGEARWKADGLPAILRPGVTDVVTHKTAAGTTFVTSAKDSVPTATTTAITATKSPLTLAPTHLDPVFLENWRSRLPPQVDVRLSDDAGRYLCEFILYTGLAQAIRDGRSGTVMFLHVPGWVDPDSVTRGRDVTIALVKTLVDCWVAA